MMSKLNRSLLSILTGDGVPMNTRFDPPKPANKAILTHAVYDGKAMRLKFLKLVKQSGTNY